MKKINIKNASIGIFDSGLGGLTVLKAISQKLPNENIIYFGDTAHLPYGDKSPQTIEKYSYAIVNFLKNKGVKLIVIACNTASVFAYEKLKVECSLPIIGVVDAGVKEALKKTKKSIMIIGTYGTIKSRYYEKKYESELSTIVKTLLLKFIRALVRFSFRLLKKAG